MGVIYHLFCTVTGKAYVGQTWGTPENRWMGHCKSSSNCTKLRRAIRKYGSSVFVCSILTQGLTTQEDMDAAEKYWVKYFDCINGGYNLKEGGSTGRHSEDTKRKISCTQAGICRPWCKENIKMAIAANCGRKLSGEHKMAVLSALKKAVTAATTRSARVARSRSSGVRPFICVETGVKYEMIQDAAQSLGLDPSALGKVLRGKKLKSTGGYSFKYIENPNESPNLTPVPKEND